MTDARQKANDKMVAAYTERLKRHICEASTNPKVSGHYASLSISRTGIVEIGFEDADGMSGDIEFQTLFCPYCGVQFKPLGGGK